MKEINKHFFFLSFLNNIFNRRTEAGKHLAPAVTVGDRVLLPEFGGAKVTNLPAIWGIPLCYPRIHFGIEEKITERV